MVTLLLLATPWALLFTLQLPIHAHVTRNIPRKYLFHQIPLGRGYRLSTPLSYAQHAPNSLSYLPTPWGINGLSTVVDRRIHEDARVVREGLCIGDFPPSVPREVWLRTCFFFLPKLGKRRECLGRARRMSRVATLPVAFAVLGSGGNAYIGNFLRQRIAG